MLDRDDCPWYDSVKLYRQQTVGDWQSVFAKISEDLSKQSWQSAGQNDLTYPEEPLDKALALLQQGLPDQARDIYEKLLAVEPDNFEALHFLGIIAYQAHFFQQALDLINRAIAICPNNPVYYSHRGLVLHELKQFEAALDSYDQAVAIKPDFADAWSNRGLELHEFKQFDAALESYSQAIAIKHDFPEAWYNRGNTLMELKRLASAIDSYDKAITLNPSYVEAFSNRGLALQELKQFDAALASFDQAISINPNYADAYLNRGSTLQELKQFDAALYNYDQAIAIQPAMAEAWSNRGKALHALRKFDDAIDSYNKSIAFRPDNAAVFSDRGNAMQELKDFDAALASYDQAIAIDPDFAEPYSNRGLVFQELKQLDAALANYDRALTINPDYTEACWNKSLALLLTGDYDNGWRLYEWRKEVKDFSALARTFTQPLWTGNESIEGKTILLYAEQGLGDTIQFCRYVKLVADLGAQVILEVEASLIPLLSQIERVSRFVAQGDLLPEFDFHCPLLSLPLAFRTTLETIPSASKYLSPDLKKVAKWAHKLGNKTKPRIGLVWSGNQKNTRLLHRSIPLSELLSWLPAEFQYVSLQKEVWKSDKSALKSTSNIVHFGNKLKDFADTAALCELMDVIITIDTSVAHLGAAMGKQTWIMLPFAADWRWLLDRDDSPWYECVKLFRQQSRNDWQSVFAKVRADLSKLAW
jgi:hypothetical protein